MLSQWTQATDKTFAEAVQAIREDIATGTSFEGSLEHYAALFEIAPEALRHEWNLRTGDRTHRMDKAQRAELESAAERAYFAADVAGREGP